jgi:hypothetical protein
MSDGNDPHGNPISTARPLVAAQSAWEQFDIVQRLRKITEWHRNSHAGCWPAHLAVWNEAADEIERLRKASERLEMAEELLGFVAPACEWALAKHGPFLHAADNPGDNVTVQWTTWYQTAQDVMAFVRREKKP